MKKMLIAGNWKMNTVGQEALSLAMGICETVKELGVDKLNDEFGILICPPFINIPMVSEIVKGTKVKLGAQNCSDKLQGAFTGEVSVPMIKHYGCSHIIIGHSERRQYYHENDSLINQKLKIILESGLNAIVCIGETLGERQSGKTFEILSSQIKESLMEIKSDSSKSIVIAYEPVWAIGAGVSAETKQVEEAHAFIRKELEVIFGDKAKDMLIQYGGSVNEKNAQELLSLADVNGALVGGASLKVESFVSIIHSALKVIYQRC